MDLDSSPPFGSVVKALSDMATATNGVLYKSGPDASAQEIDSLLFKNQSDGLTHDEMELLKLLVYYNAARHMALYEREKNGLLVWKAFKECRRTDVPLPNAVLEVMDKWADALATMSESADHQEILKALDLHPAGGNKVVRRLKSSERNREVMESILLSESKGCSATAAIDAASRRFRLSIPAVKIIKSRWLLKSRTLKRTFFSRPGEPSSDVD